MTNTQGAPALNYDAWAHGAAQPVYRGSTGTSASGWVVRVAGQAEDLHRAIIPSRGANRRDREAAIMAVVGVLEVLPEGSTVRVRLTNEELVHTINAGFVRSNGTLAEGWDWGRQLIELRAAKRINLRAVRADRKRDYTMAVLAAETSNVAAARLDQLGEEAALSGAVGPKQSPSPFNEVDGYEEKPTPIRRKKRKAGPR